LVIAPLYSRFCSGESKLLLYTLVTTPPLYQGAQQVWQMQSALLKLAGLAIVVAVLASVFGAMLPTRIASTPQRDRIIASARVPGASNVRIRAAEIAARRAPSAAPASVHAPVVLPPPSEPQTSDPYQAAPNSYTGTAPVPQTSFATANEDAPDPADQAGGDPDTGQ
jgi:hypothetical protein